MTKLLIHSHRGLDFGPENTLAAFRAALKAGCGLELDVRLTKDNNIAIIHDSDLARVSGVPAMVKDLTMIEIKHQPIKSSQQYVPSFGELAALLEEFRLPQDAIAIHLKEVEQTEQMMRLLADKIAEHQLQSKVFIFDVTHPAIDFLHRYNPTLRLAISLGAAHHTPTIFTMEDLPRFPDVPIIWWDEWGEADGKRYAGTLYTEENLYLLKERRLKVYAISPDVAIQTNHPLAKSGKYQSIWKNLIAWRVDGICTDASTELITFLKE